MPTPTCETCQWWDVDANGPTGGWCHRYPPSLTGEPMPNDEPFYFYPSTDPEEWCGEHEPREGDDE